MTVGSDKVTRVRTLQADARREGADVPATFSDGAVDLRDARFFPVNRASSWASRSPDSLSEATRLRYLGRYLLFLTRRGPGWCCHGGRPLAVRTRRTQTTPSRSRRGRWRPCPRRSAERMTIVGATVAASALRHDS
jgi:hypothetical protein